MGTQRFWEDVPGEDPPPEDILDEKQLEVWRIIQEHMREPGLQYRGQSDIQNRIAEETGQDPYFGPSRMDQLPTRFNAIGFTEYPSGKPKVPWPVPSELPTEGAGLQGIIQSLVNRR